MTPDDSAIVLSAMRALWPSHTLTDDQVRVWASHLSSVEYEDAMAVLTLIERTSRFWPHWSEFVAVWEPMMQRRREQTRRAIGPDHGRPCTPEEAAVHLERCRAILARSNGPLARTLRKVVP